MGTLRPRQCLLVPLAVTGMLACAGCGSVADRDVIRAWWSLRSLVASHWLIEHGFDPDAPGCEFDVLRARTREAPA